MESSMIIDAAAAAKSLQLCPTLYDPIDGSPPGSRPWDSPGKNTGVGCHFLLQCMKMKSESEVIQSCLTCSNPMDCSLPGSSVHGIFLPYAKQIARGNFLYNSGNSNWCSLTTKRGGIGQALGGEFKRAGTYVYLWLTHVDVWQKPKQYGKVIILQLKVKCF